MAVSVDELAPEARAQLEQNLAAGEEVQLIIVGKFGTALIATDRRCFIYKKGFLAGAPFGVQFASFDYGQLSGVDITTGIVVGAIVLQGSALLVSSAGDVPHGLVIAKDKYEDARAGVALLRGLIAAAKDQSKGAKPDVMDQLRKLGELRSAGVLTDGEFDAKKAELLSRL